MGLRVLFRLVPTGLALNPQRLRIVEDQNMHTREGCECKGHPFDCYKHPHDCPCTDDPNDPRIAKLEQALREAMEWNWLDEDSPPPQEVVDQCKSALMER
jgi:hypothetical protein